MMMMTCVGLWYGDVTRTRVEHEWRWRRTSSRSDLSLPVPSRPSNFKSGKSALDFELTCTLLYLLRGTARHTGEISVQGLLCSTPEFYSEFFYSRVYPPERQSTTGSLSLSRPPPSHLPLAQRTHIPHNLRSCCFLFGRWSERISKGTQLTLFSDQYEIF